MVPSDGLRTQPHQQLQDNTMYGMITRICTVLIRKAYPFKIVNGIVVYQINIKGCVAYVAATLVKNRIFFVLSDFW